MIQQKYRSATFKKGETEDHMYAVGKVYAFLYDNMPEQYKYMVDIGCPVTYPPEILKQLPKNREYGGHTFDLGIYQIVVDMKYGLDANVPMIKPIAYIEINGNVGFNYYDGAGRIKHANPTKHSLEKQKKNDKINKNYCELMGIKYITPLKEEIMGDVDKSEPKWTQEQRDNAAQERKKNMIIHLQRELIEFLQ
jgi:hypothetical protein